MSRLFRWYGAGPLHLLTMLGCLALAGYAAVDLFAKNPIGIAVWLIAAVIGHDLILVPLYTLADRSVIAVFRHRPSHQPPVPWINYLRVPVVLSGLLLLIWFPLIFRLPKRFTYTTTLPLDPYLWHWLAVTGALFLLSATAYAVRLRTARPGAPATRGKHRESQDNHETMGTPGGTPPGGTPPGGSASEGNPAGGASPRGPLPGGAPPWEPPPGGAPPWEPPAGGAPPWGPPPGDNADDEPGN